MKFLENFVLRTPLDSHLFIYLIRRSFSQAKVLFCLYLGSCNDKKLLLTRVFNEFRKYNQEDVKELQYAVCVNSCEKLF